jgi:SAM-dependent methyltransferase
VDVPFWRRVAVAANGRALELGCGTGRISLPLVRAGVALVGVDRSAPMLARAERRIRRLRGRQQTTGRLDLVRGDIRRLPFGDRRFGLVLAPYGVLQSLLDDRGLALALREAARVLEPGGLLGVDLVPDVPNWREYENRIRLRGRSAGGARLTLVESVRQDRRRRLTTFEERYVERRGRKTAEHRFELTFRTLSVQQMTRRLTRAGFVVEAILGDYQGRPWDARAEVWIVLARRI